MTQVELLKKYSLSVKGHLGQHVLLDPNMQRKIVDCLELDPEDRVLEIGPGLGALTAHVFGRAAKLWVVEKDARFVRVLEEEYRDEWKGGQRLIHEDILKVDFSKLFGPPAKAAKPVKVLSNLPYYITAPILFHLIEHRGLFSRAVLTLQKEVADRLLAAPGSKDYGRLTLALRYAATIRHALDIPPRCFAPPPRVESAVIVLEFRPAWERLERPLEDLLFYVISVGFRQRRKTLAHMLVRDPKLACTREEAMTLLERLGLDAKIRGEQLLLKDFLSLAEHFYERQGIQFEKKRLE